MKVHELRAWPLALLGGILLFSLPLCAQQHPKPEPPTIKAAKPDPHAAPIKLTEIETLKAQVASERLQSAAKQNRINQFDALIEVLQNKITLLMSQIDSQRFAEAQKEAQDCYKQIQAAHPGSEGMVVDPDKGILVVPEKKPQNAQEAQAQQ
jgi:hypothetical protein